MAQAEIGVIGGSGFYDFLDDRRAGGGRHAVRAAERPVTLGTAGGRAVAFLPRHGRDHRFPPHRIPYRANLWALRSLGVRQVLAPVRGRRPAAAPRPRRRSSSPTSSSTAPAAGCRPSTTPARCTSPSPTPTAPTGARSPCGSAETRRLAGHPPRDDGRRRGPALLDPGRVARLLRRRLGRRQHDRPPGGRARPRAGALLHGGRAGDRPRRRRRGRVGASACRRCSACSPTTSTGCAACSRAVVAELPRERRCPCARALDGLRVALDLP